MIDKLFFFLAALLVLASPLPAVSAANGQAPEHVRLQLKYFHQFQFGGYYAAKAQGYYAEEGLDVEINERRPGQDYIQQILSDQTDYGIGDSGIIAHYAKGEALVALAAIFQHDALVLYSKQSSGIISPYEIAGKLVMYDTTGENNAPIRALLAEAGLNESRYIPVAESFDIEDLIQGKVDAMSGYLTDKPFEFQQRGIKVNIINPQNYGIDFYGDLLFTSQNELQQHPGRADRFRRASLKGWQYALDHPEEVIQLIINEYQGRRTAEQLRFEAAETRKLIMPNTVPLGQIEAKRLRRVAETYANLKLAPVMSDEQLAGFIHTSTPTLDLSIPESNWLEQHPTIRVGTDRNFPPYEWIDQDGNYVGMVAEHLRLIEKILGVHFEIIQDKPWHEILEMAQRGELDMIAAATETPERQQYLNFSAPYVSTPAIIIGDDRLGYIGTLELLAGQKVSVVKGYFIQELLARHYPKIETTATNSVDEALALLEEGEVNAYIGDAASASFIIKQRGYLNLRFAGQSGYQNQLQFAVGKAHPELLNILQKALNAIPANQRESLVNRWLGLKVNPGVSLETLAKYTVVTLLILLFFSYWVFRLRKEIKARCRSEADLALLYRNMSLGLALHEVIRDAHGRIIDARILMINPAFETIIGIKAIQCIGKRAKRLALPHLHECIQHFADIETQHHPSHFEIHYPDKQRWLAVDAYQAGHNRFVVLLQDISQRKLDELALKASEERLRVSQYYGCVGTWEFDLINNRQVWSEIFANGLGFPKTENPKWAHFLASICKEDRPIVIDTLRKHLRYGAKYDVEYRINVTGKKCWMRSVGQVERNEHGKPVRMLGIVQDISERKHAEEKLKLSARVFSDAHEGIMITDAEARILDVNAAFTEITGFSHDEVIGKNPSLLKSNRQESGFYTDMWRTLSEKGHWQGEIWNRHKNNGVYAQLLTISALFDESGTTINYIGLFSDITARKQQQELLEHMAHFDPLTSLPNRTLFSDRFNQAIAQTKRSGGLLAICYLDLDGFKPVNDTFGHAVGDELLIEVAKRIKSNLRECDTVCRLGGDEFALLLLDLQSRQQCEDTLNRIHTALAEPFTLNVHPVWIGASCGVTLYPLDNVAPYTLLRHADQAMYQAKHAGRNCYRIYLDLLDQGVFPHDAEPLAETE
ncbi:transporter substrate-binding domain-containing protein [Methylomonas sp.]|jgi:GGDEF domain-containing protein/ABC-type nitrate/sulfonate/bicarbonate transport system substrate-binding protein|uniref:ABC transporter substrate-binding protein n=1 Tax=Methylomonas sp. TaxID=418 RepID=UPI0025FDE63D|nr:transporter substrate-binding domain-containing protein [Methylomonas sp.]